MIVYEQIFKKYGFSSTQQEIIKIVGTKKIVLEIGSSTGYMTKAFLENGCIVDVVEIDKKSIAKIPKKVRRIFNKSIEDVNIYSLLPKDYDYIIMADVLEHLVDPEKTLKYLYKITLNKTALLISLPNVACWAMRKQLFFNGDFEYQESGLLDKTHLHFYTINTLPKVLSKNGWQVDEIVGTISRLPFDRFINKIPFLYKKVVKKYRNLSYFHFLVIASKK